MAVVSASLVGSPAGESGHTGLSLKQISIRRTPLSHSLTPTKTYRYLARCNLEILACGLNGFEDDGQFHLFVSTEWGSTEMKAGVHIITRHYLASLPASTVKQEGFLEAASAHVAPAVKSLQKPGASEESTWQDLSRTLLNMSADMSQRN